jgi:hypothetical protein
MFYKIVHHIVAVPTTILIPTDPRIRQFHPFTYRHLHAFKDPYKYSVDNISGILWQSVLLVEETGGPVAIH